MQVIGLAKRLEEVFKPGMSKSQNIPKTSAGLHLLRKIRDEVHRYAITFHRKMRKKDMTRSIFEEIAGMGPKRINTIWKAFDSLEDILQQCNAITIATPANTHFDMNHSGARLAWDYFHPGKEPPKFINYIEDCDLWAWKLYWRVGISYSTSAVLDVPSRNKMPSIVVDAAAFYPLVSHFSTAPREFARRIPEKGEATHIAF